MTALNSNTTHPSAHHALHALALTLLTLLTLVLAGCAEPAPSEREAETAGTETPERVVIHFLDDLNRALQDPHLADSDVRDGWAGRLSNYFAPGERLDQRAALGEMLASLVRGTATVAENERITVELLYTRVETVEQHDDRASIHVVDGWLRLKHVRIEPNGSQTVLSEESMALRNVTEGRSTALPVLLVNGRWYMTEW